MKRTTLITLSAVFLAGTILEAQTPAVAPPVVAPGQRQGGPRQGGPTQTEPVPPPNLSIIPVIQAVTVSNPNWWKNNALVTRLGLSDVQKAKIESTFEAHRQNLISTKENLEKEEAQLAKLLEAETIDRGAIFTQINRVIQARGEMERTNATMTMDMREQLTRAQWTQLQAAQPSLRFVIGGGVAEGTPELTIRRPTAAPAVVPGTTPPAPSIAPPQPGTRGQRRGTQE